MGMVGRRWIGWFGRVLEGVLCVLDDALIL